jgi:hypothetical protein
VEYPLVPSRLLRQLLVLLWGLVLAVDAYWLAVAPPGDWRPWVGVLLSVLAGGLAWRAGPLVQPGVLSWDGTVWWWERDSVPATGHIVVRLDLQSALLLRFVPDSGIRHWLWLEQSSRPGHWLALRRAAHAASGRRDTPASVAGSRTVTP